MSRRRRELELGLTPRHSMVETYEGLKTQGACSWVHCKGSF